MSDQWQSAPKPKRDVRQSSTTSGYSSARRQRPRAKLDDKSAELALELTKRLAGDMFVGRDELGKVEEELGFRLRLARAEAAAERFRSELELAAARGDRVLFAASTSDHEAMPVDSLGVVGSVNLGSELGRWVVETPAPWSDLGFVAEALNRSGFRQTEALHGNDAAERYWPQFVRSVHNGIFGTLFGRGGGSGGGPPTSYHFDMEVHTRTRDLRVTHRWSGDLIDNTGRQFGNSRTTPVRHFLEMAEYQFGIMGGGMPQVLWDPMLFHVPETSVAHLDVTPPDPMS